MELARSLQEDAAFGGSEPAVEIAARYATELQKIGHGLAQWEDLGQVGDRALIEIVTPKPCYPTGIECLDHRLMGGLQRGKLYGLAARHKVGKSMFLSTIAYNIIMNEQPCGILDLTLEMGPAERWRRIIARHIGVNEARLALAKKRGEPELIERATEANEQLRNRGLSILGRPGCSLDELRTIVARAGMSDRFQGVIVDYLQLLGGKPRGQSTAEFLDEAAQALANAARRYGLWIIAAAQLNQEGNVRGSEGLLNACDMCLFLHKVEKDGCVYGWLEMRASRYTPAKDIGSAEIPPLYMDYAVGPHFRQVGDT
jgi:replicative DNA helicase